jgi:lipoate-protein ligase A
MRTSETPDDIHRDPALMLAWSEWLANSAKIERPLFALWRPRGMTTALGLAQSPEKELLLDSGGGFEIGLVRRQSGGGAVLLYPGVLCWEALASVDFIDRMHGGSAGIRPAYDHLSRPITDGLARLGIRVFRAGVSDLSIRCGAEGGVRKVAGTAQYRHGRNVLVHGALLVDADIGEMARYLAFPSAQPDYRQGRGHRDFCVSLAELPGVGAHAGRGLMESVVAAVRAAAAAADWESVEPPDRLDGEASRLEMTKYRNPDWNWSRKRQEG